MVSEFMKAGKLLVLVILTLPMLCSCNIRKAREQKRLMKSAPVRVEVARIQREEVSGGCNYVAQAVPDKSNVLSAPYSGVLEHIYVKVGQRVRAGETLALVISETVLSAQAMSEADLKQAEDAYSRLMKVKEDGSVAQLKIAEVEASLSKAQAAKRASDNAVERGLLKAPFDGVVSGIFCDEKISVNVAEPVLRVDDDSNILMEFSVPEGEMASLRIGRQLDVVVPALGTESHKAAIVYKDVAANPVSRTYKCRVRPSRRIPGLMLGMVGKVRLSGADNPDRGIVIPSELVRLDDAGKYIWIVDSADVVRKVYVSTGGFSGRGVVVLEGLDEGDRIITAGASKVSTGMKVEAVEQ